MLTNDPDIPPSLNLKFVYIIELTIYGKHIKLLDKNKRKP